MTAWYVVYTHAQAEAKALEHLRRQGYQAYLPRYHKWRRHARRREFVRRPLFPRYLFVALDLLQSRWRPVLSTVGVCEMVRHGDSPAPVPSGLVEALQERERAGAFDEPIPAAAMRNGDPIKVLSGPFADLVGQFYGLADAERVYVLLEMLGRRVKTRLSIEAIAPA